MEGEKHRLYIPIGLKERYEFWDGFGKEEAVKALIFIVFSNIINFFVYFITKKTIFCSVWVLVSIAGSAMMLTKDVTNLSVVDQIQNMIRFLKSQKHYSYRAFDEW